MTSAWICIVTGMLMLAAGASQSPGATPAQTGAPARPDDAARASAAVNQFGLALYSELAPARKGNLFLSPYSVETALAMTLAGARGQTAAQMAQVLRIGDLAHQPHGGFAELSRALAASAKLGDQQLFDLSIANAIWLAKGYSLNPDFVKTVKEQYSAGIEPLDFASSLAAREQARQTINAWIAKQTNEKIKDLLAPGTLDAQTRLVLTNAIYFKSQWDAQFSKSQTRDEPFHVTGDASVTVPMMHQMRRMHYAENDLMQAVEIPYRFRRLSMIALLPRKTDGMAALEKSLTAANVTAWSKAMGDRQVELSLPRFQFSSRFDLGRPLAAMGMAQAFSATADFSGISAGQQIYISDVVHQAFVDVNEEGTEAAAATAVVMHATALPRPAPKAVFRADRPFLFLIRDNTSGCILFLGRVNNPKE